MKRTKIPSSTLTIRENNPWVSRLFIALALALIAGLGWFLYSLGGLQAGFDNSGLRFRDTESRTQIQALNQEVTELREKLAIAVRGGQVDNQASLGAKNQIRALQDEMLELKEELAFYRGIVAADEEKSGIQVERVQFTGSNRKFRYNLMLTQVLKSARYTKGRVGMQFDGVKNGEIRRFPLSELVNGESAKIDFRFKYFQAIEGEVTLPEGFQPNQVIIDISPSTKGATPVSKTFDWSVIVDNVSL